jgi:AraC-like DNA-binding protein
MAHLFFDALEQQLPYRLRGIGIGHTQEAIRRPHGYPYHQWLQIRSGRLRLLAGDAEARARAGDGMYLRPREFHAYVSDGRQAAVVDWLCFDGSGVEGALAGGPLSRSGVYRLADPSPVNRAFEEAWSVASGGGAHGRGPTAARLSARVYEILMVLNEAAAGPGQSSVAEGVRRLQPALRALDKRPAAAWDVDSIASIIGVTPQHLGRLFRGALGQSPMEYLIRSRMNLALRLLLERPDLRVHEVGAAVGYPDPNYFIRLFRDREGSTPGQFRALHGEEADERA